MTYQDGKSKWMNESLKEQALPMAPKNVYLCL